MVYSINNYNISTNFVFIDIPKTRMVINTLNPHSMVIAENDTAFRSALLHSDILIPDGIGIVLAARLLSGIRFKRFSGYDLQLMVLKRINQISGRCFYLGASDLALSKIKGRVNTDYENITVETYSPSYEVTFSELENQLIIAAINKFRPDVLFVGMTAPKQEKWVEIHRSVLQAKIICSIGGAFDFYAGTKKRAPLYIRICGLEWLSRLITEPARMWRRNFISTPLFILIILKLRLKYISAFFSKLS